MTLASGGPLSHVRELAPRVATEGAAVTVLCANEGIARSFRTAGVAAAAAPLAHKLDLRGTLALRPHLRHADVVHTHDRRGGLLVRPLARTVGAAPVHTFHGVPDEIFPRVGRERWRDPPGVSPARLVWLLYGLMRIEAALSRFGTVVIPSQALADFAVQHGFPRERIRVIPNGISVQRDEPRRPRTPRIVATSAHLLERKGIDVLIEALARVSVPVHLDVYGDGPERPRLQQRVAELAIDVTFHGFVDDVAGRGFDADLFVLPSRAENLPVAVLEAMASAIPVVATRVGGVPELVIDGETGFVVEPDDVDALASAIERVLGDPERLASFGRAGAQRARAEFDTAKIARRMVDLYEELCGSST